MALNSVQNIATFINGTMLNIPVGISGNMVDIVDTARQHVSNFTGYSIDPSGIATTYQTAVLDFALANTIDLLNANGFGGQLSLGELSLGEQGNLLSAEQYRLLGEMKLKAIGRKVVFSRVIAG